MRALMAGTLVEQDNSDEIPVSVLKGIIDRAGEKPPRLLRPERPLRCVWTGYPTNGCSCHSRIPKDVVTAAWRDERASSGEDADRFFHFVWGDGVWLGYGLKDGRVRGVCCPAHGAERALRCEPAEPHLGASVLAAA
jgi:hypothetical protein